MDGAVAEYREALRLNPNNAAAHNNLGAALGEKGDWDGAIAEISFIGDIMRKALRGAPANLLRRRI